MPKPLVDAQMTNICKMYREGFSYKEIASACACSTYSVWKVLSYTGNLDNYARRSSPNRAVTQQIVDNRVAARKEKINILSEENVQDKIIRMLKYGYPVKEISNFLKVSESEILKVIKETPKIETPVKDDAWNTEREIWFLEDLLNKVLKKKFFNTGVYIAEAIKSLHEESSGDLK